MLWERHIGVVGSAYAGKTVFLTSLINHLKRPDAKEFSLGNGVSIANFHEMSPSQPEASGWKWSPDPGWGLFDYAGCRESLANLHEWPRKTTDRSQYACQFDRSDWRLYSSRLKFYDFPGERLVDAKMVGMTFEEWSDHMVKLISSHDCYRRHGAPFFQLAESAASSESAMVEAFKSALVRMWFDFASYISPSTFLVDAGGKTIRDDVRDLARADTSYRDLFRKIQQRSGVTAEDVARASQLLADKRVAGLSPPEQFAPLPELARERHPELAATFAARYDAYRQQVVAPLILALKACHSLVFLIDIPLILGAGHDAYNENCQMVDDFLDVLDPGQRLTGRAVWWFLERINFMRPGRITKIAFTASKVDQVRVVDRDKFLSLLRSMVEERAQAHTGLEALFLACSSVVSTRTSPGKNTLIGRMKATSYGEAEEFEVSVLPDGWPEEWPREHYRFVDVLPDWPKNRDHPPKQINLDKILNFIMQ